MELPKKNPRIYHSHDDTSISARQTGLSMLGYTLYTWYMQKCPTTCTCRNITLHK